MTALGNPTDSEVQTRQFSWLAYFDEDAGIARAICLILGLLVGRPTIKEAVAGLQAMAADYLRETEIDDYWEGELKPVPPAGWEAHIVSFAQQCSAHPEKRGHLWDCGTVSQQIQGGE